MLFPRPYARPYFIVEKQGPTIEDLLRANQFGILDVSTARFIAIGIIQVNVDTHTMVDEELIYLFCLDTAFNA